MSSWAVVIPSNRPDKLVEFLEAWQQMFDRHDARLIVVRDEEATWSRPDFPDWMPRRSDMIRSFGFIEAYHSDVDYVLTLDDDERPQGDLFEAYERSFARRWPLSPYLSVASLAGVNNEFRGFPFADRWNATAAVQYGCWDGVLDYDAPTQLVIDDPYGSFADVVLPVPMGTPFTGCIMNVAWRREYTPAMWQLPLMDGKYDRFGDIWSGLFVKLIADRMGDVVLVNGSARTQHERASDPFRNLEREQPGISPNEGLWRHLSHAQPQNTDMWDTYVHVTDLFAGYIATFDADYAAHFVKARDGWGEALGL